MLPSPLSVLAGFLLRLLQVTLESSLYLLIGFVAAGVIRAVVGPTRMRSIIGDGRFLAPLRAWGMAVTMLPVCALGILPVAYEMRRSGVARHALLTLMLTAPMLNPITLMYGLSYLGAHAMIIIVAGTFAVAVGSGILLGPGSKKDAAIDDPVISDGSRRLLAGAVHTARMAAGSVWNEIGIGVLGACLLAAFLPETYLSEHMFVRDPLAIPRMALLAPASYLTPENAMTTIPEVMKFRQSPGAMFLLLSLGAGMTLGHLAFFARGFGKAAMIGSFAAILGIAVAGAYMVQAIAPAVGTENQDNDHFGELGNPFYPDRGFESFGFEARSAVALAGPMRWASVAMLVGLALAGTLAKRSVDRFSFEGIVNHAHEHNTISQTPPRVWDRSLSRPAVAGVLGVILVAAGMAGALAYYPAPSEVFRDMKVIKADVYSELGARDASAPLHHLDLWDRQASKLAMGAMIRLDRPSPHTRKLTSDLRGWIAKIREAVSHGHESEARTLFINMQETYDECASAYDTRAYAP